MAGERFEVRTYTVDEDRDDKYKNGYYGVYDTIEEFVCVQTQFHEDEK